MCLEYVTKEEFSTMLTQRYPKVARDRRPGRAKNQAREVVEKFNGRLQEVRFDAVRTQPRENVWDEVTLFQRTSFEVSGELGSAGPDITVLKLVDPEGQFKAERETILNILSEKQIGFNVSNLDPEWEPGVVILINHAHPPTRKSQFDIPTIPFAMPLDSPKAYLLPKPA